MPVTTIEVSALRTVRKHCGESLALLSTRGIARPGLRARRCRPLWKPLQRGAGGLVEAYPVADWSGGAFGNMATHGTVSMVKKGGFGVAALVGNANVLMRRGVYLFCRWCAGRGGLTESALPPGRAGESRH